MQAVALAAARREVVAARSEAGADPTVVDRVLRRLDVRSMALPREARRGYDLGQAHR